MTNSTFNKAQLKSIRSQLENQLGHLDLNGIEIKLGNCSYSDGTATFKLVLQKDDHETPQQMMLAIKAEKFGIDINKVAFAQNLKLRLVGYNTRAKKMPWQCADDSGKRYKMTTLQVLQYFKFENVANTKGKFTSKVGAA